MFLTLKAVFRRKFFVVTRFLHADLTSLRRTLVPQNNIQQNDAVLNSYPFIS